MKKHSASPPVVNDEDKLEQLVHDYYRRTGRIVPQTPEDVARAEAEDAKNPVKLPPRLRQPDLFGETPCAAPAKPLRFPTAPLSGAAENLARAAREGGTISPEIEARMEQDRARAEREANKEDKPFK